MSAATEFSLLRAKAGISIDDFADQAGFSRRTVYRWKSGDAIPRLAAVRLLRSMARKGRDVPANKSGSFRFIDLFAGIGGLRRGFEDLGGRCVFTSEWDKYSQQTYLANFHCEHEVVGDITKVPVEEIPAHDLLLAGFPLSAFLDCRRVQEECAQPPHGFADETQGTLFFNVAQIIRHHRPKAFLLENVKNLVNHDKGRTFVVIHRTLTAELGYQVHGKVINPSPSCPSSASASSSSVSARPMISPSVIWCWRVRFPSGADIIRRAVELRPDTALDPDRRLLRRRECEFEIFRSVEQAIELPDSLAA